MEALIKFLIFTSKLKFTPRKRWVLLGVKDSETVADHMFMTTFLAWIFSEGSGLNSKRLLKIALAHSLDLVFPVSKETYIKVLQKNPASLYDEKQKSLLGKMIHDEEASLHKLLIFSKKFKEEILDLWEDFRFIKSKEAKFLYAVDSIENLVQALVYKKAIAKKDLDAFWLESYHYAKDKQLVQFLDSLKQYDTGGEGAVKNKEDLNLIKFIFLANQLKEIKRKWDMRGVPKEDSESAADHAFRVSIMAWLLSESEKLDVVAVIKMSLIHDLCNVYVGEMTIYDRVLTGDPEKDKISLRILPHYLKEEKERILEERRKLESEAFDKLLDLIPGPFAKEVKELWLDYEYLRTPEGRFVRQVDRIEPLLQALEYKKEGKAEDITVYWYQVKEWIHNKNLLKFVSTLDDYYYKKQSLEYQAN